MILNQDIHKFLVILGQESEGRKLSPKLKQVINRWISGVLITCTHLLVIS